MKNKLLMISTAALLAGTLAAASQSIQPGGAGGDSTLQKGKPESSSPAPKSNAGARDQGKSQTQGQAERAPDIQKGKTQGEAAQDKLKDKTQGQAERDQDKAKSQTQGQAQQDKDKDKGKIQTQGQREQDKAKSETQGQAQQDKDKGKIQTQGQAPREQDRQGQAPREQDRQGQIQRDQDRNQQGAREGERGSNVSVSFTTEQRTKIRETVFKERNAPRVGKVDFSIKEGTVIPRTVRVVEIPDVIVEIHPEWRTYKYFIVNEELVVVDPATLRIVAVIDV
jgi:hypothetical protein